VTAPARLRDIVVVGGGCYGSFYAAQLAKARERGKATYRRVIVVDRDPACRAARDLADTDRELCVAEWSDFLTDFLPGAHDDDYLVPSPHMPHLLYGWLLGRARARWPGRAIDTVPVPGELGTAYDRAAADATRYVSFADWVCPTHCVEPAICPAIGSRRTWEMEEAVTGLAARLRLAGRPIAGPVLFPCRHHVYGVGTVPVAAILAGDRLVAGAGAAGGPAEVLVGTISRCHGALNLLALGVGAPAPG
jgi:hypothetical protein